jgi:sulfur carrier protein ThiS
MNIYIEKDDEYKELNFKGTVLDLLRHIKINPSAVFVVKNGKAVGNDDLLSDKDNVRILEVFMGG